MTAIWKSLTWLNLLIVVWFWAQAKFPNCLLAKLIVKTTTERNNFVALLMVV
jgi:hypothetical protein